MSLSVVLLQPPHDKSYDKYFLCIVFGIALCHRRLLATVTEGKPTRAREIVVITLHDCVVANNNRQWQSVMTTSSFELDGFAWSAVGKDHQRLQNQVQRQ